MIPQFAFLSDIGGGEVVLVGIIALLLFGKNLPLQARNIGRAIAQFKQTISQASNELNREMDSAAKQLEETQKEINKDNPAADIQKAIEGGDASGQDPFGRPEMEAQQLPSEGSTADAPSSAPAVSPSGEGGSAAQASTSATVSDTASTNTGTPPEPAVSEAALLDTLARNIRPPRKIPRPVM